MPVVKKLPREFPGFELQSLGENTKEDYAQAYFVSGEEHLFGVVVVTRFKNMEELKKYTRKKLSDNYSENNTACTFQDLNGWKGFNEYDPRSYYLAVSKGEYLVESEFHNSFGYNASKERLKALAESLSVLTLRNI